MNRVISECGNVIAADFRPRTSVEVQCQAKILYLDDQVCLMRFELLFQGNVIAAEHITTPINNTDSHA